VTEIIRYAGPAGAQAAVRDAGGGLHPLPGGIAALLAGPAARFRDAVEAAAAAPATAEHPVRLLPPVDGLTEVWAAGVTYQRSSAARQEESQVADVYARVYDAARPELFFKSPAWRVCGPGEPVGVRPDSPLNVPEPELAVVLSADGAIVGATICDDVSSRSIEGENPLYLPQAKVYAGACALGPAIVPAWELPDLYDLTITVQVSRDGGRAWGGTASTAALHRRLDELAAYLYRGQAFPHGAVLSTVTGLVPDLDFSLVRGDRVLIDIDGLGSLVNPVTEASAEAFAWLTPAPDRQPPRQ
jgi:2-dehydro-3-deoxy-D-arabinonate dehydratase